MEKQNRRMALKALSVTTMGVALSNQSFSAENMAEILPLVVKSSESRKDYTFWNRTISLKIGAADTNKQLSMFYGNYHKNDGPPLHIHFDQDEQFYILEGEVLVQAGKEQHILHAGDTIFLPRNIPHTYLIKSETAKMIFQTTPSGKIEDLFQYMVDNYKTASMEEIGKAMAQFNHSFVGPPLSAK
jgi:quercetin 2,3-dioxygenase